MKITYIDTGKMTDKEMPIFLSVNPLPSLPALGPPCDVRLNLTDQLGPECFGGFDGGRSLFRCIRVLSENDGAPDYS
jgi:hypothetical protein